MPGRSEIKTKRTVEIVTADLADATDLLHIEALLTEREDIDVLINNAGLGALGPTSQVTADHLENLIKINILALTRLTHAAPAGFLRRNCGTIINIASMIAVMPTPSGAGYSGSKAKRSEFHALAPDGACQDKHRCSGGTSRSGSHRVF